jgi:hypothetical protein
MATTDYIQAWQCIGCGRIEAPQPCIGVCRDRKILMVAKEEYESVCSERDQSRALVASAIAMLQRVARSTPRDGQWERSYRALQDQARDAIARLEGAGSER